MQQNEMRDWTFRLRVDQQSVSQASQAAQRLQDRIKALREETQRLRADSSTLSKEFQTLGSVAELPGVERARSRLQALKDEIHEEQVRLKAASEAADEYNDALERTATVANKAGEAQRNAATYRSTAYSLSNVGSLITQLSPQAGASVALGSELFRAAGGVSNLREQLPKLTDQLGGVTNSVLALGGAGGALALGYLALDHFNDEEERFKTRMEESRTALSDYLDKLREFHYFLVNAGQGDIAQRAQDLIDQRKGEESYLADVQSDLATLQPLMDRLAPFLEGFGGTGGQERGVEQATRMMKEAGIQVTLSGGQVISTAEDLVNAWDLLKKEEVDSQKRINKYTAQIEQLGVVTFESGDTLTTAGNAVVTAFEGMLGVFNVFSQTTLPELEKRLDHVNRTVEGSSSQLAQGLAGFSTSYGGALYGGSSIAALAAQSQAEKEQDLADAIDTANQYLDDQAETEAKRTLTLTRDQEDADRKRARDIAAHYADLAQLDADYYAKVGDELAQMAEDATEADQQRLQELADYNQESERQAEDHRDQMLDIQRSLDRGVEGAVEDRSVSAAIEAVRQAKQQAEDEQDQYDKERERREEDFADQLDELEDQRAEKLKAGQQALADLKQQHTKERTANIQAFNQRLREEDQERQIRLTRQQQDWATEDQQRAQHFSAQLTHTANHWGNLQSLAQAGMGRVETAIQQVWDDIVAGLSTSTSSASISGSSPLHGLHSFAAGGTLTAGELVRVGDDANRFELAQFNRDGSWQIFNNRQSREILSAQRPISVSLSMPIQTAVSAGEIDAVVEQRVVPKIIRAVQQASRQAGAV